MTATIEQYGFDMGHAEPTTVPIQPKPQRPKPPAVDPMVTVREAIAKAMAARDAGIARAEEADRDGWDKRVIDQAIAALVATGRKFSANDLRELLPVVRQPLIGGRVIAAKNRREIRKVGSVPSTLESTHGHEIGVWIRNDSTTEGQDA